MDTSTIIMLTLFGLFSVILVTFSSEFNNKFHKPIILFFSRPQFKHVTLLFLLSVIAVFLNGVNSQLLFYIFNAFEAIAKGISVLFGGGNFALHLGELITLLFLSVVPAFLISFAYRVYFARPFLHLYSCIWFIWILLAIVIQ